MTKALTKQENINSLIAVEQGIKGLGLTEIESGFEKAITITGAIESLQNALNDEVMKPIMRLQGNTLGFRTDYDSKGGYPLETVRDSLIEAVLRGVQPVGNQFNIIAGRCYITKEGFTFLLKNLKGFSDFKPVFGIPQSKPGGAIVKCSATWKMGGKGDSITCDIPVKVNQGMGSDAILGKATRKLMARVYAQATGTEITDGEAAEAAIDIQADVKSSKATETTGEELYGEDDVKMEGGGE